MSDPEPPLPSLAQAAATLTELAHARGERERLVEALGTLCETSAAHQGAQTQALLTDLLSTVLAQAGPEERARLADRLAAARWAPPGIALQLSRDPLKPDALAGLARRAGSSPALRMELARHPGLRRELAEVLSPLVSEALRRELEQRFGAELQRAAVVQAGPDEAALAAKLKAAGRLGPGALLRFLREGRGEAFRAGVVAVTGDTADAVSRAWLADTPDALEALAARAGLDRAVLPEVVALVRRIRGASSLPEPIAEG